MAFRQWRRSSTGRAKIKKTMFSMSINSIFNRKILGWSFESTRRLKTPTAFKIFFGKKLSGVLYLMG
jgi:hypothetical protein